MKVVKLALNQLFREWRSGELHILFLSIVIAVAAISSVSFFTDRINQALLLQANELLGADVVLKGDREFSDAYYQAAEESGLQTVRQVTFPTMVLANEQNQMVWLNAVDENFPLRGEVGITSELFKPERRAENFLAPGKIWVEPAILTTLELAVGDKLQLGMQEFVIDAIITTEPGRAGGFFNIAPRVIMNIKDVASTKLIQPGSRARYGLLAAGDEAGISAFRDFVKEKDEEGILVQGVQDARPDIRAALTRAEQFLGLAALTSLILSGVAVALSARRFTQRHLDHCAIMRCVGATQSLISQLYLYQILMLGFIASVVGVIAGFFAHGVLVELLGAIAGVELPGAGLKPVFFGLVTGIAILAGFALPPVMALKTVPALRVLKRDLGDLRASNVMAYGYGIGALVLIMIWQAGDLKIGLYMVAGALAAILLLALCGLALLSLLALFKNKFKNAWFYGLRNLVRRPETSVVQIVAFGVGIMALLILTLIRGDLLSQWQQSIPEDAPNRFVINISPDQVKNIQTFFRDNDIELPEFYPMVRGRIVEINDEKVSPDAFDVQQAKQLLSRELNLSWADQVAEKNQLVDGEWWDQSDPDLEYISIEESVAKHLELSLGDVVRFKVADQHFRGKVASIRKVDWGSFRANFYVLAKPGLLTDFPATYMSPFFLAESNYGFLNKLVNEFPNITVIDVATVLSHARTIIQQVSLAIEYVFLFTLMAGAMVLFAGIQSTHDERMLENAIMRTLGGRKKQMLQTLLSEFLFLGILAGMIGAIFATITAAVISHYVLQMPISFNFSLWFYGILVGGAGVSLMGMLGSKKVLSQPPLVTLKKVSLSN